MTHQRQTVHVLSVLILCLRASGTSPSILPEQNHIQGKLVYISWHLKPLKMSIISEML